MGAFDFLLTDRNKAGYHDPVTSTIDWCELNYLYSYYIAEFYNTLTNVPVILLGLYAAWATVHAGVPARYSLVYLGLALIGVGSFGFHCSLKWEWQMMDELPMIYVVSYAAYLAADTAPGFEPRYGLWGPLVLVAWVVFVTVSYYCADNPVLHQIAFATIMLSSIGRCVWLVYQLPRERRAKMGRTLATGTGVFAFGFLIWNIDNQFCHHWRAARDYLADHGLGIIGPVTEGHGWWHLMTGYGGFLIFTACIQLCLSAKTNAYAWDYDSSAWFPIVHPVDGEDKVEEKALLEATRAAESARGSPASSVASNGSI